MKIPIRRILPILVLPLLSLSSSAQHLTVTGPAGCEKFGSVIAVLANGNYVIADPFYDNGVATDAGAVYLFHGKTHALISTLRGSSAGDQVGTSVVALPNGNFVVGSPNWHKASNSGAGAATWINGKIGLNGVVSPANSLVGTSVDDHVGSDIKALTNGNFVVTSGTWHDGSNMPVGAATWGDGSAGIVGAINSSNSLTGSSTNDFSNYTLWTLGNGNYVVVTSRWDNGSITDAGAVTWCNGNGGRSGVISSSSSLVGSSVSDMVGFRGIAVLKNNNYVVYNNAWHNGSKIAAGAVTWCSGTAGRTGAVSSSNSIVGSENYDEVGQDIMVLANGNYVILSPYWNNGSTADAGAATWCNGTTGRAGTVNNVNSLVGTSISDNVGRAGCAPLTNGNYVIVSHWTNGTAARVGAATLCNGNTGTTGSITATNSLIGAKTGDLAAAQCVPLDNGNYVVLSPNWANGTANKAGAATWCPGNYTRAAVVSAANSLVGTQANDQVGYMCAALKNGNYVVLSSFWTNGSNSGAGAATWCDGLVGRSGAVSNTNSLVGMQAGDAVGSGCIALTNGNYVVLSSSWSNGTNAQAGAATWCPGTTTTFGPVDSLNSIIGSAAYDRIGSSSTALSNGNCVIGSYVWSNGQLTNAGAATWINGQSGAHGVIDSSNSLIGSNQNTHVGVNLYPLPQGNYMVHSPNWVYGSSTKTALTLGDGAVGTNGYLSDCNSASGLSSNAPYFGFNPIHNYVLAGFDLENKVVIVSNTPQGITNVSGRSTRPVVDTIAQSFLDTSGKMICALRPLTPVIDSGSITARVFIDTALGSYNGHSYVQRHFDLSTTTLSDTGSAYTTLYFTQEEFDNYNKKNSAAINLPLNPSDAAGITHLWVTLQRGFSASGMPGTYSGWTGSGPANIAINPEDKNIVWNACDSRWEVSFDMKGYGGLFLHGSPDGSPLSINTAMTQSSLRIAPIPAREVVQISCDAVGLLGHQAAITDVYGKTVQQFMLQKNQQLDISNLAAGVYFLRAGGTEVHKFVKQ